MVRKYTHLFIPIFHKNTTFVKKHISYDTIDDRIRQSNCNIPRQKNQRRD